MNCVRLVLVLNLSVMVVKVPFSKQITSFSTLSYFSLTLSLSFLSSISCSICVWLYLFITHSKHAHNTTQYKSEHIYFSFPANLLSFKPLEPVLFLLDCNAEHTHNFWTWLANQVWKRHRIIWRYRKVQQKTTAHTACVPACVCHTNYINIKLWKLDQFILTTHMHMIVNFVDRIEIYKNAHTYTKAKIKPLTARITKCTQWRWKARKKGEKND